MKNNLDTTKLIYFLSIIMICSGILEFSIGIINIYEIINNFEILNLIVNVIVVILIGLLEIIMGIFGIIASTKKIKFIRYARNISGVVFSLTFVFLMYSIRLNTFNISSVTNLIFQMIFFYTSFMMSGKAEKENVNKNEKNKKKIK